MSEQQSDYMQGFYRGRAEGVIVEQERIIKLLQEVISNPCDCKTIECDMRKIIVQVELEEIIEHIKGEPNG